MTTAVEPVTRAEIEAAITGHYETLRRMPAHWVDRRASLHARINDLLDMRDAAVV